MEMHVPKIEESMIEMATDLLQSEQIAKMIGLVSHLTYWSVFGHFNKLPLDMYHRK